MSKKYNLACNIAKTLDIIGDRWTLLIIRDLLEGKNKFNEIKESLKGIAPNILSDRLQSLEKEGIIVSNLYSQHPPRFEYKLTKKGEDLRHVIHALGIWGNKYLSPTYFELVHKQCGHQVQVQYFCPNCNATVKDIHYVKAATSNSNLSS